MTLTQDFTFQYKDDGIILNADFNPGDPFVDVTGVSGLDSGEFEVQERGREGADGGFLDTGFKDMRTIVITGNVYGNESYLEQLRLNWKPYRASETNGLWIGGYPFYFQADGLSRKVYGRSLGMKYDWAQLRRTGVTEVQFQLKCEDPTIYDATTKTGGPITLLPVTQTGFGYPRAYNRSYGGGTFGGGVYNVYNAGTATTYPTITIVGPCDNPYVINDSWDGDGNVPWIKLAGSLGAGDTITISTLYRTIRLNNDANRRTWLVPPYVWWGLLPGDNFIRFGADALTGAQATLTYSDALE
jgi:hypothetical protein